MPAKAFPVLRPRCGAAGAEDGGGERTGTAATGGQGFFDFGFDGEVAVGGVAQKDEAQDGHTVFGGGQFGVSAKLVGRFPQIVFKLGDVLLQGCGSFVVVFAVGKRPLTGLSA